MKRILRSCLLLSAPVLALFLLAGCGGGAEGSSDGGGDRAAARGGRGGGPGGFGGFGAPAEATSIPVEVITAVRRTISDYLETNGSLEAENEVDIVARTAGPIVELNVEEGMYVREGQVLARIDADEIRAQLEIARVALEEARLALDRARVSFENELISQETYDQAKSRHDTAKAQIYGNEIQLSYTEIKAPFDGLIIERVIKSQEFVNNGSRLFRISDFTPLLCPIQVPEKDLGRLRLGQPAYLAVEAFPGERFAASVLRISPIVDSATGTVKVTLSVNGRSKLRPGMFASVYLETAQHDNAVVVPKEAMVLESIGDTVYVVAGDVAERREVETGFEESESVEILSGLEEGEKVIVVGQEALSQGTPVYILAERSADGSVVQVTQNRPPHPRRYACGRDNGRR